MCALYAAGFGANEPTFHENPAELALRGEMLGQRGPAAEAVRAFYRDHVLGDPAETLSGFMSLALVSGPPPAFSYLVPREMLPPDAVAIEDFTPILSAFYEEAHLSGKWAEFKPASLAAAAQDTEAVRQIVYKTNAYLHEIPSGSDVRSFTVFVEPLVGNRTNFRNVGDRYAIVIGGQQPFPTDAVRHAYLHFVLDPLVLRYRGDIQAKSVLLDIAARAPRIPDEYRTDFTALFDECLIKATELRLRHLAPSAAEGVLADDDASGFVLVRQLFGEWQAYERAGSAISLYFPEIVSGIDVQTEAKRLASIHFAPAGAPIEAHAMPGLTPQDAGQQIEIWLGEGDRDIAAHDADGARTAFNRVLERDPNNVRALYGLAVSSVLAGDGQRAQTLFERVANSPQAAAAQTGGTGTQASATAADPAEIAAIAWSHVYLGRIHDLARERDLALKQYQDALAVAGAPEAARVAAQNGAEKPYTVPSGVAGRGEASNSQSQ